MKIKIFIGVVLLALLFHNAGNAQTQRPKKKVNSFGITTGYAEDGVASTLNYNYHLGNITIWQFSFVINDAQEDFLNYKIPYIDATLSASYNVRILTNGQFNTFNIYLGAGVLGGYESINEGIKILENGAELNVDSKFIYGGLIQVNAELYLSDDIYLTSQITENIHINSDLGNFLFYAGIGLRMYIL